MCTRMGDWYIYMPDFVHLPRHFPVIVARLQFSACSEQCRWLRKKENWRKHMRRNITTKERNKISSYLSMIYMNFILYEFHWWFLILWLWCGFLFCPSNWPSSNHAIHNTKLKSESIASKWVVAVATLPLLIRILLLRCMYIMCVHTTNWILVVYMCICTLRCNIHSL